MIQLDIESSKITNPNGCPLSATFFVSTQYTDYWRVQRLYSTGHEIAIHTMNHFNMPDVVNPGAEITGAYHAINTFAGIPKSELLGFRHPFLNYSTNSVKALADTGLFLYESSMTMQTEAYKIIIVERGHTPLITDLF